MQKIFTRREIVETARSWKGTPFRHQGRTKYYGVDCVGVILDVHRLLGNSLDKESREMARAYGPSPYAGLMDSFCEKNFIHILFSEAQYGDIVTIRYTRESQHLALLADYSTDNFSIVHCNASIGKVVEHRLDQRWMDLIVRAYKLPGVVD